MKHKIMTLLGLSLISTQLLAQPVSNSPSGIGASGQSNLQFWSRAGNNQTLGSNNILGTRWESDIWIMTNNRYTARFTYADALTSFTGDAGDGLRIINPLVGAGGNLDLFTTANNGTNETHARFGNSGQISGQNSRMEFLANANQGFWFDAFNTPGYYKFAQQGTVYGFLGTNHFWRIGQQAATSNLNAQRRLHVVDATTQFRLSFAPPGTNSAFYTDFYSTDLGYLRIQPSGERVGINATIDPTATLDVFGDARIRYVKDTVPNAILVGTTVNTTGPSDLKVRRLDFTMNPNDVLLGNGTFGPVPGVGVPCGSPNSAGALSSDSRINLNNHNFYFSNYAGLINPASNRVAVGYNCSTPLPAKFNVYQKEVNSVGANSTAGYFENRDIGLVSGLRYIGIHAISHGLQNTEEIENIGGLFIGMDTHWNVGVRGIATPGTYDNTTSNLNTASVGGDFAAYTGLVASSGYSAYGVRTTAYAATNNYGVSTNASGGSIAYGIYATASAGTITRAGYFNGNVEVINGTYLSDQQFKDSVTLISSALKTVNLLKPVAYKFDIAGYPQFNFGTEQQYGFIAQDVETVLPSLVHDSKMPAQYDTLGNEISPAVDYKSLNYIALIPVNTKAIIELNQKVDQATLSDESIKINVQDLSGSLDKVLEMRGVSYDWDHSVLPELNLDSANHVGFIAQEMAQIDSRLTYLADDELLHVEYDKVVPILAEAIQELNGEVESKDATIDSLQNQVDDLTNRLTNLENCLSALLPTLCSMNQSLIQNNSNEQQEQVRKNLAVTLSDRTAIVLDQNVPNPFAEQTVVNFSIPAAVLKAQIHFYDGNGKLIQSVDVTERGLGSLTVFGSDLSSGTYTYTLVADGKIVATKKMMKQ